LGTDPQARFDEFALDLLPGDVLLLCSDGLSGVMPAAAIVGGLEHPAPEAAAEELVSAARAAGGPDNITALVLRFTAATEQDGDATQAPPADPAAPGGPEDDAAAQPTGGSVVPVDDVPPADPEAEGDVPASGRPAAAAAAAPPRPSRRRLGCLAAALAALAVIAAAGALILSTVFFVSVDDGRLAIYSGLPVEVGPLQLNAVWRKSARTYASLSAPERRIVDEHSLHDQDGVMALSNALGMWP
jgi:protein phosphatase